MFDKKQYIETFSVLHASEDTLTEIQKITSQNRRKVKYLPRPAFVLSIVLVMMISSAALAAGGQIAYGGWVYHMSLSDVEKIGFHYPEQLGDYHLTNNAPSSIHVVPAESSGPAAWFSGLTAWFDPDYIWMALKYENDKSQSLSVRFGKMDHPLWAYCFDYDENTGKWLGSENPEDCASAFIGGRSYIENVTEYVYEGCTIYLADRVTEDFSENDISVEGTDTERDTAEKSDITPLSAESFDIRRQAEAHWPDTEIGLCFSISSSVDCAPVETDCPDSSISETQGMTQAEMLQYAKTIIDHNR